MLALWLVRNFLLVKLMFKVCIKRRRRILTHMANDLRLKWNKKSMDITQNIPEKCSPGKYCKATWQVRWKIYLQRLKCLSNNGILGYVGVIVEVCMHICICRNMHIINVREKKGNQVDGILPWACVGYILRWESWDTYNIYMSLMWG